MIWHLCHLCESCLKDDEREKTSACLLIAILLSVSLLELVFFPLYLLLSGHVVQLNAKLSSRQFSNAHL
jgi:hypothetical protein